MSDKGPSEHLSWAELACHDAQKTPYPERWREERAIPLAAAFERIRELCGFPIAVNSGYRTFDYNWKIGGAVKSQHVEGRALDIHPVFHTEANLALIRVMAGQIRAEGLITAIGHYPTFVHIDTRPGPKKSWSGARTEN